MRRVPLIVKDEERDRLNKLARGRNAPHKVVLRARIVLGADAGIPNRRLALELHTSRPTVLLWQKRFRQKGVEGLLHDAPRPGRKKRIGADKVQAVVEATLHTTPKTATHWSVRSMARAQEVSRSTVHRIWQAHGLQPHRVENFKLSTDPQFVRKLRDIVGLYLNPPDKALVLSVDEKSQIQALDRTARCCHCAPASRLAKRTTTLDTARPPSSPPSTSSTARSWAGVCLGIVIPSSCVS